MSGSPQRHRVRHEEDISGQFRVTIPDAEELDQLRTRGGVYRRGLYPLGNRGNAPPDGHIPEWEYFGQEGQDLPSGPRPKIAREGRGEPNPPTPTVGVVGEIGRTPIPVAESTRHPGEKPLPSVRKHEAGEID